MGVKKSNKLVVRLRRRGCRFYPIYELGVFRQNQRARGHFIEKIGFYNPHFTERRFEIDSERLSFWLNQGAIVDLGVKKYLLKFLVYS